MNHAKQRVRLTAFDSGEIIHRHGCFSKVALAQDGDLYCYGCGRVVTSAECEFPVTKRADHAEDLRVLLKALDDAEDRIAELEDGGAR